MHLFPRLFNKSLPLPKGGQERLFDLLLVSSFARGRNWLIRHTLETCLVHTYTFGETGKVPPLAP